MQKGGERERESENVAVEVVSPSALEARVHLAHPAHLAPDISTLSGNYATL